MIKRQLQKIRPLPAYLFSLILLHSMMVQPIPVEAAQSIYTVQIASFKDADKAVEQYEAVIDRLDDTVLFDLRIEKIGSYCAIRLGSFADPVLADTLLGTVTHHFSNAIVMKAYLKKDRIIRRYTATGPVRTGSRGETGAHEGDESSGLMSFFDSVSPDDVAGRPRASQKDRPARYTFLPVSNKFRLIGTVITDNVKLAIIEDRSSKQSGLFGVSEQIGGFVVSDIYENTVILDNNDELVKISLWEGGEVALSGSPDPAPSREVQKKSNQGKTPAVPALRRGRRERANLLRMNRQRNRMRTSGSGPR